MSRVDVDKARDAIQTRQDLARFIQVLRDDLLKNADTWENPTLERFLRALAAWTGDMEGYFRNQGIPEPDQPDWLLIGQMLYAASIYE